VNVLIVDINSLSQDISKYYSYLSKERIDRIKNYKEYSDKARGIVAGLIINACACETTLNGKVEADELTVYETANVIFGEHGKPYFSDGKVFFNVSHSGNYVVGVYGDKEVGIDIQRIKNVKPSLKKRLLNETENIPDEEIIKYWAIKESFVKMTGMGLSYDFRKCVIDLTSNTVSDVDNKEIIGTFSKFEFDEEYELFVCQES